MKNLKGFLCLILSVIALSPIIPIKSFNNSSPKTLVLKYENNNLTIQKISYLK